MLVSGWSIDKGKNEREKRRKGGQGREGEGREIFLVDQTRLILLTMLKTGHYCYVFKQPGHGLLVSQIVKKNLNF